MNHLENNLLILEKSNPTLTRILRKTAVPQEFEIEASRSGAPTLKIDSVYLHSAYHPVLEAERQAERVEAPENSVILLQGLGMGYLAEALLKRGFKLIIAEADTTVLRAALESRDLTQLLNSAPIFCGQPPGTFREFLQRNELPSDYVEVSHNPSVRRKKNFYESLGKTERFIPPDSKGQTSPAGLKILLPSPLYGGSLPIAYYCKDALESLGHKVEFIDNSFYYPAFKSIPEMTSSEENRSRLQGLYTMFLSELVLAKAIEVKPDLIFGVAQSPFTTETIAKYKALKIPLAFWFMEDFRLFQYWKTFAPLYDYFFTIQRGEFSPMLDELGARYKYLPLAADPEVHQPLNLSEAEIEEYGSVLSFVGAGYYNRHHFFLQLLNEDLKIWGVEWNRKSPLGKVLQRNGERIPTEETVKIFNASQINVNLHSSSYHNGVNPHGDFVNPRAFEIAACAAFQLVDPREELPKLFEIEREIATFKDVKDLRSKMKYYLENPAEMRAVAEAGRARVLRHHTYRHRMEEMLSFIAQYEPSFKAKSENPNLVRNLLNAAGNDAQLRNIFERFEPDEELDIDKIAENIRSGSGELNQAEGVFLLMKEFYDWAREKKVI